MVIGVVIPKRLQTIAHIVGQICIQIMNIKTEILKEIKKLRDIYSSQVRSWNNSDADKWWDTQVEILLDQVADEAYHTGYDNGENSGHVDVLLYLDSDEDDWQKAIDQVREQTLEEVWKQVKEFAFDLVEECNPNCTEAEHAYHKGTWNSYLKLEELALNKLKEDKS